MDGSIYDFRLQRSAFRMHGPDYSVAAPTRARDRTVELIGLITNPRSHRSGGAATSARAEVLSYAPGTRAELRDVLAIFARRGIDLLAIDGGDGTIRDVLTCAGDQWAGCWPTIAILPSGKTNALALDLGVPANWTLDEAIAATARGRTAIRRPIEVERRDTPGVTVRGFLFGAGAFVQATALAQRTHRAGAFNGVAVGLAITWSIAQTLFGGPENAWRQGDRIGLTFGERTSRLHAGMPDGGDDRYLVVASTLQRLPLGLKPFGKPRGGLKTLVVDAPPRRVAAMIGPLLAGSHAEALERNGYHRVDTDTLAIDISTSFILDGETFPAGGYLLREASPLRFAIP